MEAGEVELIRNHSHYSLLISTSRSEQIVSACKQAGYQAAGITDIASISGCVDFVQACKKGKVKPLLGSEIVLSDGSTITLLCKNKDGWNQLVRTISRCNSEENYDEVPKISFEELVSIIDGNNFICIDGYVGSLLFNKVFKDKECIFSAADESSVAACVVENSSAIIDDHINSMKNIFSYYYLEINKLDAESFPVSKVMADLIGDRENTIPDTSTFYPERKDAVDHRVLICIKQKTTMRKLQAEIQSSGNLQLLGFIRSSTYYIKKSDELKLNYSEDQFKNLINISELCEDFSILSKPKLPKFETRDGVSEIEYLKDLCRAGWKRLISDKVDKSKHEEYKNRVLTELEVINKANLAGYFLIVQDYVNHFRNQGCLIGPGRGSGGGSLVCYLTGITLIDPIKYGLLFERFYNEGRNTGDHISLPDIDVDFPPSYRDKVVSYLKNKYGEKRVCQMLTFGRLAGKSIIKEILRVNESCGFDQMNKITEKIPNESAISDLLEEMENPSVIRWALENDKESLADYCWLDSDGSLQGDFAKTFEQAMRMEGIFKTQGKHAAGVVIASEDLTTIFPMVKSSRSSELIAGMEMEYLEAMGGVKFDILGVAILEKISNVIEEVNNELS